ncbi:MAG: DUF547 domain-containing protein [Gammaproteobacteria bacterium]|nr:DUF547 domain-containing protein [Gammaproteobacteria bacterium]
MTKTFIALLVLLALAAVVLTFFWVNRPRKISIDAPVAADFPEQGFSHDAFEALLREHVTPGGRVDYDRWHASSASVSALDSYLAAVSRFSPETTPTRFPERNDALAYWMYGYNAYVIKAVLDRWPVSSVTDIKAPIEAVKGMGFFFQLRFSFGGEHLSLLAVENEKIRARYQDARIHFVLNCASESCPVARPELPTGNELEELMARAAVEFVNDPDNVSVDHDKRTVFLSTIFKWYKKDFINDLRARGRPSARGLIDYVADLATGSLRNELERADNYKIEFRDYDWRLNEAH